MGETEPPDHPERLEPDALRQLRLAVLPVHEDDRHLVDAEPAGPGAVGRLDLERVPVGTDSLGLDRKQRRAPPALEATRHVANGQAGHGPGICTAEVAEQQGPARPAYRRDPLAPPR